MLLLSLGVHIFAVAADQLQTARRATLAIAALIVRLLYMINYSIRIYCCQRRICLCFPRENTSRQFKLFLDTARSFSVMLYSSKRFSLQNKSMQL